MTVKDNSIVEPTTFAEDSWETIALVVKSGQSKAYQVGSEKEVEIAGQNYTVRVANNTTPAECNGENFSQTACGFVVEFVDIVEEIVMNDGTSSLSYSNSENLILNTMENNYNSKQHIEMLFGEPITGATNKGGWPATPLKTYANGDFFNNLPSDLQKVIIETKVVSGHGSTTGETNFPSTDKIYLLSSHEVYEDGTSKKVSTYDTAYNQTRQLDYYKNLGVTTSNYSGAIKKYNNSNSNWWLRAPYSYYDHAFLLVTGNGFWSSANSIGSFGLAPAFRIGQKK